jgi:hypothetical protein
MGVRVCVGTMVPGLALPSEGMRPRAGGAHGAGVPPARRSQGTRPGRNARDNEPRSAQPGQLHHPASTRMRPCDRCRCLRDAGCPDLECLARRRESSPKALLLTSPWRGRPPEAIRRVRRAAVRRSRFRRSPGRSARVGQSPRRTRIRQGARWRRGRRARTRRSAGSRAPLPLGS